MPADSRVLNWHRIADWTDQIADGELADVAAAFARHDLRLPIVSWKPQDDELPSAPLRALLSYWLALCGEDALPDYRWVDPLNFRAALGFVIILERTDDGREFRYRLFGSSIARTSGFDMTGKLMSAHPASSYATEFAIASSLACARRGVPLYTERQPAMAEMTTRWPRLALPLRDEANNVVRLLVGTTPLDRNGRIVAV